MEVDLSKGWTAAQFVLFTNQGLSILHHIRLSDLSLDSQDAHLSLNLSSLGDFDSIV